MFNIENDGTAKIAVNGEHITLRAILLLTETDNRDTLLSETKKHHSFVTSVKKSILYCFVNARRQRMHPSGLTLK
jgi:hypothetical protein